MGEGLLAKGKHLYLVDFSNVGGLVTPLILEITLKSGKKYIERVPAEVWRYSPKKITKLIVTDEPMVSLTQDPYWETADIDTSNNSLAAQGHTIAPGDVQVAAAWRRGPDEGLQYPAKGQGRAEREKRRPARAAERRSS
jgi:hypothetical protein